MPQIANIQADNRKELVERMPYGTSTSSDTLRRTALDSMVELHVGIGTGTGSALLRLAAIRALGGFSFGSPQTSSARDIKEIAHQGILRTLSENI